MISADDIAAFEAANKEAFAVADRVIERAEKGAARCRLWSANEELPIVRALRAQRQIIAWLTEAVAAYAEDEARRFEESIGVFDRHGNRTD